MSAWLAMAVVVLVGTLLPLQGLINARLGDGIHGPVAAAFVSFLVGTVMLGLYLLATRTPLMPEPGAKFPAWIWLGGAFGALYVAVFTLLVPRLGAAAMICLSVFGQATASLLLDHYGVLQAPRPVDWTRILGALLVLAGVLLVAAPWRSPPRADAPQPSGSSLR